MTPEGTPEDALPTPMARAWAAPLVAHLLVLAVVLAGVAFATSRGDSFVTDDGSYEIQLRALQDGSWTWSSGTERLDPTDEHFPIVYAERTDDGWVPLAKHPAWPWLANAVAPVTGVDHAYAALGLLAVVLVAVAAWFAAGARDPAWSRPAFWLAGLAPMAITATIGWAHAAAAATAGLALLGAVRLVDRPRSVAAGALLVAGVGGLVLLRSEGLLFAIALAGGIAIAGWRGGRLVAGAAWAGVTLAVAAAVTKLEGAWIRSITGGATDVLYVRTNSDNVTSGYVDARFLGAVRSLIDATGAVPRAVLVGVVLGAAVAAALVASGRAKAIPALQVLAVAALVLLSMRVLARPTYPVTGLLVAWPAAVVGLGAAVTLAWRRLALEATTVVLFVGAVLATQYADGGAGQWGGRFYAPATVAIAVLAAAGLARIVEVQRGADPAAVRGAVALVAALVVLPLLLGVLSVRAAREASSNLFDAVERQVEGVAITPVRQLPRMMWRHDVDWLVVDEEDPDDLADLLQGMAPGGEGEAPETVSIVLREGDEPEVEAALAQARGWRVVDEREADGLQVWILEPTAG